MLDFISHLISNEQQIFTLSPVHVSLLIAGADGHFDTDEKKEWWNFVKLTMLNTPEIQ
jgi:hypothetical protein